METSGIISRLRRRLEDDLGYSVWAEVHDLSTFGLPQRRVRALVIARRDGPVIGLPRGREPLRTVRDAIGHLPTIEAGAQHPDDPMHVSPSNTPRVLERIRATPLDGGSWSDIMTDSRLSEKEKRDLLIPAMFRARPGSFPDVYGRLWWDRPAVTITRECGHVGNGRYVHPDQDRLLTVREMALLQGFLTDFYFDGRLTAKYNQIGDAVPPMVAAKVAKHIIRIKTGKLDVNAELVKHQREHLFLVRDGRQFYVTEACISDDNHRPKSEVQAIRKRKRPRRRLVKSTDQ